MSAPAAAGRSTEGATGRVADERPAGVHIIMLLAVGALILYHYTYARPGEAAIAPLQLLARQGFLGIDVFLMTSGYLVVWAAHGRSAMQFVRARVLRRYPEFWVAVLISGTIFHFAPIHAGRFPSAAAVVANLTMVPQAFGFPFVDSLYEVLTEELRFSFVIWVVILSGRLAQLEFVLFAIIGLSFVGTLTTLPFVIRAIIDFPVGPLFALGGLLALVRRSGWTAPRATFVVLALVSGSILALREMTAYVDPADMSITASFVTVALLVIAATALAGVGGLALSTPDGRLSVLLAGLAYPLLLLESTGKALFLRGLVNGPRPLLVLAAVAFSLTAAVAVWQLGTGPVRKWLSGVLGAPPSHPASRA